MRISPSEWTGHTAQVIDTAGTLAISVACAVRKVKHEFRSTVGDESAAEGIVGDRYPEFCSHLVNSSMVVSRDVRTAVRALCTLSQHEVNTHMGLTVGQFWYIAGLGCTIPCLP